MPKKLSDANNVNLTDIIMLKFDILNHLILGYRLFHIKH